MPENIVKNISLARDVLSEFLEQLAFLQLFFIARENTPQEDLLNGMPVFKYAAPQLLQRQSPFTVNPVGKDSAQTAVGQQPQGLLEPLRVVIAKKDE
ncbi:MAG: hypothetical protein ACUVS7_09945, partial [Bryobacteraceae bacterium]